MPHHTPLIATIVVGLSFAFVLGAVAQRLKVSPIAGYLLAGILVGPYTPGFVADEALALELAEIGVILLMFGVGLHFSFADLMSVRKIAIPGAIAQIGVATVLGSGLPSSSAGRSARVSFSGSRFRSQAPLSCSGRCRSAGCSILKAGASPWVG